MGGTQENSLSVMKSRNIRKIRLHIGISTEKYSHLQGENIRNLNSYIENITRPRG